MKIFHVMIYMINHETLHNRLLKINQLTDYVINEKPSPCFISAIEKQISRCNALEHLESSGTTDFMNGPIVCN